MTFSSQLEARQFLINKIANEASLTGIVLSDAERRMLQLNLDDPESATGIPVEVLEDTSRTYEKKMFKLLRAAFSRDQQIPQEQQRYREAIRTLRDTDHYILIIATGAIPQKRRLGNYAVYIIIALAVAAMILALQLWTRRG
jgi:hypothetical protein